MLTAQPASRIYRVVGPRRMIAAGLHRVRALVTLAFYWVDFDTNLWVDPRADAAARPRLRASCWCRCRRRHTRRSRRRRPGGRRRSTTRRARSRRASASPSLRRYLTSRLTNSGLPPSASPVSFQESFLFIGILSAVGIAVAVLIKDRDAAATMDLRAHDVSEVHPEAASTPAGSRVAEGSRCGREIAPRDPSPARRFVKPAGACAIGLRTPLLRARRRRRAAARWWLLQRTRNPSRAGRKGEL